ncbi:MAG: hypothetical protein R6W67_12725 [Bacteroidales bacterium]
MRSIVITAMLTYVMILFSSCSKEKESERFRLLTGNLWQSHLLMVDGEDESAGLLAGFVGEAKFNKDGTGYFGQYTGTWYFSNNENNITITTPDLPAPLTTTVIELTSQRFKISTSYPIKLDPMNLNLIEISFVPKP